MQRKLKPDDEKIYCPEVSKWLMCPKGTVADMVFLRELGVDPWAAFNWIIYMIEEWPFTAREDEMTNGSDPT